jgi:formate dehydrogenase iron-sulfur subunit
MKAVVWVPNDSAAVSVGANDVAEAVENESKKRGLNVTVKRNGSRGMFYLEPLVEVETPEGRMAYGPMTPEDIESLFDAHFLSGREHPLGLGRTEEIAYLKNQERLTFANAGLAEPLDIEAYVEQGGFTGLGNALQMEPAAVVADVTDSGLRGRGGAGFPTGIKWKTVLEANATQKYVACNADEGDSGTFADRMVMEGNPFGLIEGMTIAGIATGATEGYVYVRSEYPDAISTMGAAVVIARRAGWLGQNVGGSGKTFDIHIRRGASAYICGEESSMLESLEGKRGIVRSKPPIPALKGLFGKPTVVNNVLTLASVPVILSKGAHYYKNFGMGRSRGTLAFQLAGNIKQGGLVEKAFGVTIRDLIETYGGGTMSGRPFRAAQIGGPLGAYVSDAMLDLPMDYEALAAAQSMVGHGGVVVFDDSVDMGQMARFAFEFCAIESCGKCTPCRVGAVRGKETMDKILAGDNVASNVALVEDLCQVMTDGSLCAMGGLTPMPVLSALRLFPEDFDRAPRLQAAE